MTTTAPNSAPQQPSYVIVGAGVFGASTALHLIQKYPGASVTLVDRDAYAAATRVAASWDWNKVVRADYADIAYCRLALEAQDKWRRDPLWMPFYKETGIYWISRTGIAQKVLDNFRELGRECSDEDLCSLPVDEAKVLYGGLFDEADYEGVERVLVNKTSGWADAKGALQAVIEKAVELGVKYVVAEVAELTFGAGVDAGIAEGEVCTGIRTASGETIEATHVILSTGSFTPRLLDESASVTGMEALRAGDRIIAAAVTTGLTQLDDETAAKFAQMPVCIQENPPERGKEHSRSERSIFGDFSFERCLSMTS